MKIWNVNVSYYSGENEDLGTYITREKALTVAKIIMDRTPGWKPCYESDDEIQFKNGNWTLIVESIYVA